jgi:hypothetical protein
MLGFDANNNKMLSTFGPASQYHAKVCVCKLQNYRYFATEVYINLLYTPLANREEILIKISEIDSKKTKSYLSGKLLQLFLLHFLPQKAIHTCQQIDQYWNTNMSWTIYLS